MAEKMFIDNHCHLFNIVDVPLYETLMGQVQVGTLRRLVVAFGLGGGIAVGLGDNILNSKEEFIRFFERSIEKNIQWLAKQVKEAVPNNIEKILITPLIMDFDILHEENSALLPSTKVDEQLVRLKEAIEKTKNDCDGMLFCPFLGFDLRKLDKDDGLTNLKDTWKNYGIKKSDRSLNNLEPGKALGIKLYPPIGFNPYPENDDLILKYNEFYNWCALEKIPITTHCQNAAGSYSVGVKNKKVNKLTHAKNWWRLFNEFPQLRGMNINFAHFGGEDGLEDMIDPNHIDKNSWTYYIIQLLKRYPNTYSDISAFDFADKDARKNLRRTLNMDRTGKFDDGEDTPYKLENKLLWGSDVPMVISGSSFFDKAKEKNKDKGYSKYKHLYDRFTNIVKVHEKLTCDNSKAFLML